MSDDIDDIGKGFHNTREKWLESIRNNAKDEERARIVGIIKKRMEYLKTVNELYTVEHLKQVLSEIKGKTKWID